MSEPKTDTFDRLKKFMSLSPNERDEALYLQSQRFKSILESEGIMKSMREMNEIMNGTPQTPGLPFRVTSMEEKIRKLVKSNANLQKALYICTGFYLAIKFYFEYLAPHKP
jgi:hypothetical protein